MCLMIKKNERLLVREDHVPAFGSGLQCVRFNIYAYITTASDVMEDLQSVSAH
jgi:hypothetical protein